MWVADEWRRARWWVRAPVPQPMSRRRWGSCRGARMGWLCMRVERAAAWASRRACSGELVGGGG